MKTVFFPHLTNKSSRIWVYTICRESPAPEMLPKHNRTTALLIAAGASALLLGAVVLFSPEPEKAPAAAEAQSVDPRSVVDSRQPELISAVSKPVAANPSLLGQGQAARVLPEGFRLRQLPAYQPKPDSNGQLPAFPTHEFRTQALTLLRNMSKGDPVNLKLIPGFEIAGVIDSEFRDLAAQSYKFGIALANGEGRMTVSDTLERTRAHIFYQDKSTAHRITGFPKTGEYIIEELPLTNILCCTEGATYPISNEETLPTPNRVRAGQIANAENPGGGGNLVLANSDPPPGGFQSLSGSQFVIYLDFDGEVVNDSNWSDDPINAQPSGMSAADQLETLRRVAEDFAPWNINVTDNRSVFDATPTQRRTMCVVTPTDTASPGAGGVAFLDTFRDDFVSWCFVVNDPNDIADTVSHEVGHQLKLAHDGRGGEEYHPGHGTSPMKWGPIMGAAFNSNVSQWSNGDYSNSTNQEDDIARISTNGFGLRNDDVGNSIGSATVLTAVNGDFAASGVIERNTDVDFFRFTLTSESTLVITATPKMPGPNMKADLRLYNVAGSQLRNNVGGATMNAAITQLLAPGDYFVSIQGTSHLTPDQGWSGYASIGQYDLLIDSDNDSGGGGGGGGGDPDPQTLANALDISQAPTALGEVGWSYQTDTTSDGEDAAASGAISHDEFTGMQFTVADAQSISFYWKVSSEHRFDYLNFYINGVRQARISGEVDWVQQTYNLNPGSNTLRWIYDKDESVSNGDDKGYVDRVVITSAPASGFYAWIASQGVLELGPNDDPDRDGVENLLEYVTGGNANGHDPAGTGLAVDDIFKVVTFRYKPGLTDVRLRLQGSSNLLAWLDLANGSGGAAFVPITSQYTIATSSGPDYDTVTVTVPNSANWQFYRLVVDRL